MPIVLTRLLRLYITASVDERAPCSDFQTLVDTDRISESLPERVFPIRHQIWQAKVEEHLHRAQGAAPRYGECCGSE